jgi:hypothetical protein
MDNFPENIIFIRLKLPFSFRRRGWGMRPKTDFSPTFHPLHFPNYLSTLFNLLD